MVLLVAIAAAIAVVTRTQSQLVLAHLLNEDDRYDESFAMLDAALAKDPDNLKAWFALGSTANDSGKQLDRGPFDAVLTGRKD